MKENAEMRLVIGKVIPLLGSVAPGFYPSHQEANRRLEHANWKLRQENEAIRGELEESRRIHMAATERRAKDEDNILFIMKAKNAEIAALKENVKTCRALLVREQKDSEVWRTDWRQENEKLKKETETARKELHVALDEITFLKSQIPNVDETVNAMAAKNERIKELEGTLHDINNRVVAALDQ